MNEKPTALIVDDEPDIIELFQLTLAGMDITSEGAADIEQAKQKLASKTFDLCFTDMRLPDGEGIELLQHIQYQHPELPTAVITAHGNMELAIDALKAGAFDFVSKPVDLHHLRNMAQAAIALKKVNHTKDTKDYSLLGVSSAMQMLRKRIFKVSTSQAPVVIFGPSGAGKERVARLIHEWGARKEQPFVAVNCGAIPKELMESEFFGHLKGSFTGAAGNKEGLFQEANHGTLFLDEVGELPMDIQVKLLRAIQEKAIKPVGATKEERVDVRILSATHKDLHRLVAEGKFREDLYYRIHVIDVVVPGLADRQEDIPILAEHILSRMKQQYGNDVPSLSDASMAALAQYDFPGNVRELENILERAVTLCERGQISPDDLQLPEKKHGVAEHHNLDELLEDVEKEKILGALEHNKWNKTATAETLGISLRTLRYRLKKFGID